MKIIALLIIMGFILVVSAILKFWFKNYWKYFIHLTKDTENELQTNQS